MDKETEVLNTYILNQQEKINTLTQQLMFLETRLKLLEKENETLKNINSQYVEKYEHKRSSISNVSSNGQRVVEKQQKERVELSQFKPAVKPPVKKTLMSIFKTKE